MPHHAKNEVLAARAFGTAERFPERFEQLVDAFAPVEPAGN